MNAFDLTPLYRNSVGFDRFASLLNSARSTESNSSYPPYNIEILNNDNYAVTLAVAGFSSQEIDINVERSVLTVKGQKENSDEKKYLYQGIANRSFKRTFNLADYIEVRSAELNKGLLTIFLEKEIPKSHQSKNIEIKSETDNELRQDDKNKH
ncbi:Hsp20 family protein [Veronia pacifica]|uniref:Heat-shock protein n=1 Tax=Veronia pacifica TaxID=1080227 RepID=A0A1C3EAL5_9GAMM|nr:Hsp20 family protein [Veronia pacifica]ODA30282.1 heat-shock protein [Veronia pacifica]